MITGLQSTFVLVCTSSCLLILLGCGGKPDFGVQEVRSIEIQSSAGSRTASSKQVKEFITAFQRARILRDDIGTTHEVRADVVLASGEKLVIWGGGAPFQTIAFRGRQLNLQGEELRAFLLRMGSQKVEPDGPGYLLLVSFPLIAYSLSGERRWLHLLSTLAVLHIAVGVGIVVQDD